MILDSTLAVLREGYPFISARCRRYGTDVFETRILLQRTICMRGAAAARVLYDNERFVRAGALPGRVKKTLVGVGGVQGLDGEAHRHRKQMLISLLAPPADEGLAGRFAEEWRARVGEWARAERVVLHDEVARLLARSVCGWAGVPLPDADVRRRTRQLLAMIEAPVAVGPPYWRGRLARGSAEQWIGSLVTSVCEGSVPAPRDSALYVITSYRDPGGRLLDPRVAAVELLNILRPTVAVARFVAFAALALHEHPSWRERLRADGGDVEMFVQEVRRYYPLFAAVAARVRTPFDWNGRRFPRGRRVVLDLYGTNHDPRLWDEPHRFDPERFRAWDGDAFTFVPQGGGDHHVHHRCPGEWATIALMKAAAVALASEMEYRVPEQDLRVDLNRMPTMPRSGFIINQVRPSLD